MPVDSCLWMCNGDVWESKEVEMAELQPGSDHDWRSDSVDLWMDLEDV